MKICQNCGKELLDEVKFCSSCGNIVETVKNDEVTEESTEKEAVNEVLEEVVNTENCEEKPIVESVSSVKKKFVFTKLTGIIIVSVLVVCAIIGVIVARNVSLNKYEEKLTSAYERMTYGAEQAEQYATLQSKVWRNCIYENDSIETDKYTKNEYGRFYDDFNDALSQFYEGEKLTHSTVDINVLSVDLGMAELKDCPEKFEDEYKALKELYVAYSDMTDLVIGNSSYSCTSYSDALDEAKAKYKNALFSAKLMLE